ncbi:MAG: ClpP family protease [Methylovirgula sp.]
MVAKRKSKAAPRARQSAPPIPEIPMPEPTPPPPTAKPFYVGFNSEINQITGPALIAAIGQQVGQGFNELHLMLTTPGGHVAQGIAIYNMLRALPISITTYNVGSVNSIGNVIFLAGSKRYAAKTSSFMFHGVGFDVQSARFEEKALKERLQSIQNDQKLIADIIVRHTKITETEVDKLFLEAAFVDTGEAKRRGIIDDILDVQVPTGTPFIQLVFQR